MIVDPTHPVWAVRIEQARVLARAGWRCQDCGQARRLVHRAGRAVCAGGCHA